MCPTEHPSVHTSSLANVHCNEWLVWFKICDFCASINTGPSHGLLPVIRVTEILQLWETRTGPFTCPNPFTDDMDLEVGQFRALNLGLVVDELASPPAPPYPHHQGELPSSALTRPPNALKVDSTTFTPPEPSPRCCPIKVQGPTLSSPAHCEQSGQLSLPLSRAQSWLTPALAIKASSTVLPRVCSPEFYTQRGGRTRSPTLIIPAHEPVGRYSGCGRW